MNLLFFVILFQNLQGMETLRQYQPLPEAKGQFLEDPFAITFAPNGKLFVVDRLPGRIHVWDTNGQYLRSIGARGLGPGELNVPIVATATADNLIVWELRQQFSIFDHQGKFLRSFKLPGINPRRFAALSQERFVITYQEAKSSNNFRQKFALINAQGERLSILGDFKNSMFLKPIEGNNKTTLKAFGPEGEVQRDSNGNIYFGFSQGRQITRVNAEGKAVETLKFDFPKTKPTSAEVTLVKNLHFPNPDGGQRIRLSDIPSLKFDYDHPKANYTHFTIKGDRIAFILTPIGGLMGVPRSYHTGTYIIFSLIDKKLIRRGRFQLPEDSLVYFQDGRIIAFLYTEEGDISIREVRLRGF